MGFTLNARFDDRLVSLKGKTLVGSFSCVSCTTVWIMTGSITSLVAFSSGTFWFIFAPAYMQERVHNITITGSPNFPIVISVFVGNSKYEYKLSAIVRIVSGVGIIPEVFPLYRVIIYELIHSKIFKQLLHYVFKIEVDFNEIYLSQIPIKKTLPGFKKKTTNNVRPKYFYFWQSATKEEN